MTMKFAACILKHWLGEREYDVYDLNDPDYARHATATEWLREKGYEPEEILAR